MNIECECVCLHEENFTAEITVQFLSTEKYIHTFVLIYSGFCFICVIYISLSNVVYNFSLYNIIFYNCTIICTIKFYSIYAAYKTLSKIMSGRERFARADICRSFFPSFATRVNNSLVLGILRVPTGWSVKVESPNQSFLTVRGCRINARKRFRDRPREKTDLVRDRPSAEIALRHARYRISTLRNLESYNTHRYKRNNGATRHGGLGLGNWVR